MGQATLFGPVAMDEERFVAAARKLAEENGSRKRNETLQEHMTH